MPYSPVTITGYNSNPPPDDGTQVAANEIVWANIKAKLSDPLKTAIDAMQTAIDNIIDSLEANIMPAATVLVGFRQTSAPVGWTKNTTLNNNSALRLVTGTPSNGGATAFGTIFAARTIAQANLPNVDLLSALSVSGAPAFSGAAAGSTFITNGAAETNFAVGGATSGRKNTDAQGLGVTKGTLAVTGTALLNGGITQTTMDFDILYVDIIQATKDAYA